MLDAYPKLTLAVGAERVGAEHRETLAVLNPATGAELGRLPCATAADADAAAAAAAAAFPAWAALGPLERARAMLRVADGLAEARETLAALITTDLGKPLAEARVEVDTAIGIWRWNAEEARRLYGRLIPARTAGVEQSVRRQPVGPVAAFAPWNAPLITPSRKISSALGAGCSVVLKAAEEAPGPAVALLQIIDAAGVPPGTVNLLFGDPAALSKRLLASPHIQAVTFTGSTAVGRTLAAAAMSGLKRLVMELGGHAPVIVTADTDIDAVADASVRAKYRNSGQVCTSPTRFLIERPAYDRFAARFVDRMKALRVGDGHDPDTQMGPLAHDGRIAAMRGLVDDARSRGARIETGQDGPATGTFHPPVAILDATPDLDAMTQEPFGPLALLMPFDTLDMAIAEANRLPVGLSAYAFTTRLATAHRLADEVRTGNLSVNHFTASLPETPFGGVGDSGFGAEGGREGLEAFVQTKYVSVTGS